MSVIARGYMLWRVMIHRFFKTHRGSFFLDFGQEKKKHSDEIKELDGGPLGIEKGGGLQKSNFIKFI